MFTWSMYGTGCRMPLKFFNDFQIFTDLNISEDEIDGSRPGFPRGNFLPKSSYQVSLCNFDLLN